MENKEYKIYTLSHPITKEIRYVGFTSQLLKNRLKTHIVMANSNKFNYYVTNWIKSLIKQNLQPEMELLDYCEENTWQLMEQYWISQCKAWGFRLTNLTGGGEGICNPSFITKQRMRNAKLGTKVSEATKKKMSEAAMGRPKSEATKLKISKIHKGKKISAENIEKLRIRNTGKKLSEETKRKVSENSAKFWLGKKFPDEMRKKMSEARSGKPAPWQNKKIIQYDFCGNIIQDWISATVASRELNLNRENIIANCKGRRHYCGDFIWCYDGQIPNMDFILNGGNINNGKSREIYQFNLENERIGTYSSMSEAEKVTNISHTTISRCCKGKQRTSGGFIWRYADAA